MASLTRRGFIGLFGAASVTAAVGLPTLATIPRIVADGVHDDSDGLNALFKNEPVHVADSIARRHGNTLYLERGIFKLTKQLEIDWPASASDITGVDIYNCVFDGSALRHGDFVIFLRGGINSKISNCKLIGPSGNLPPRFPVTQI